MSQASNGGLRIKHVHASCQWPLRVKSGKVQTEQMFSGLCLKADATLERGREFWQAFGRRSVRSLFSGLNLADLHSGQRPRPDAFGQASLDLVEIAIGEPIEPT